MTRVLHAPIRVYLIKENEAGDTILLDELKDYSDALNTYEFEMLPCVINGRTFNLMRRAWTTPSLPVTVRSSDKTPIAKGPSMILGYDEEQGHRSLTDEEVMHIDESISMTISFRPLTRTHYVVNDVSVIEVSE